MSVARRTRLSQAIRFAVLGALIVPAAQAQSDQDEVTLDRIEVTGTRIKKVDIENQVPVLTLSREDIERTGLTSVGDIIQELTGSGSSLNTKFNSSGNFGFPPDGSGVGAGATTVDLRHLGSKRVLVLVDGVRWVNESSASGVGAATDLNTIPLAIIERIEVLEDGASSLYGSDAIAGVVNIITRRDFDGGQISLNYGQTDEGDGETKGADFAWGYTTDRSNLFIGASYVDNEEISAADRAQSQFPRPGTGVNLGSSFTPTGRFVFRDPNTGVSYNLTPNTGVVRPRFDPAQTGCVGRTDDFHCFTNADRFNFAPFNLLMTPSERAGAFAQLRFNISDNVTWYARALYNSRQSANQAAPEPIPLGPGAGGSTVWNNTVLISRLNPFNPFGFDLRSVDDPSTPVNEANLTGAFFRPVIGGPRRFEQDVDTWYLGTGLEGAFEAGDRSWFWDVNLALSENKAEQTNFGSYNIRRIFQALGDPAACAAVAGCTPLNIFGGPTGVTPNMLTWIQPVVRDNSKNEMTVVTANLTGDLADLWAGPLAFATGVEYRRLEGSYQPDAITVAGEYNGVPSLPTSGSYHVQEAYLEFNLPLLADVAAAKNLDLNVAGRYSDYSTFGGEFTPKYGLRWQISDDFLARATYAEGFRAPSIGELFGSDSRFDATIADPCSIGPGGQPPVGNIANCRTLGVPVGYQQPNPQISTTTGGNRLLNPETSDSLTAGFVWSPEFLRDRAAAASVDFELTYYQHELEGAIQAVDAQTQLNLCVATLSPLYCTGITRGTSGGITSFANRLGNLGRIETDGFDFDIFWTFPETNSGRYKLSWQNTWVNDYEAFGADGSLQPRQVGIEVNNSAIPDWTSNLTLDWSLGSWRAAWTTRHLSDLTEACGTVRTFPTCRNPEVLPTGTNRLGSTTYHDAQLGYVFNWSTPTTLTAGARNVFGKEPPLCVSCTLNGYDASTYDIPGGTVWYVRADLRF